MFGGRRHFLRLASAAPATSAVCEFVNLVVGNNPVPQRAFAEALDVQTHHREVDVVLCAAVAAMSKQLLQLPEDVNQRCDLWVKLVNSSQFHSIESRAVLCGRGAPRSHSVDEDTLRVTGGVVPLSERRRISDGEGVVMCLRAILEFETVKQQQTAAVAGAAAEEALPRDSEGSIVLPERLIRAALAALESNAATINGDHLAAAVDLMMQRVEPGSEQALFTEIVSTVTKIERQMNAQSPGRYLALAAAMNRLSQSFASPRDAAIDILRTIMQVDDAAVVDQTAFDRAVAALKEGAAMFGSVEGEADLRPLFAAAQLRFMRLYSGVSASSFVEAYEGFVAEHGRTVELAVELVHWLVADLANVDDAVTELKAAVSLVAQQSTGTTAHRDDITLAHKKVVEALCAASAAAEKEGRDAADSRRYLDVAYGLIVAHKYHGLNVTADVIRPLVSALSKLGDCRVFNLVDVCTLFNENTIDLPILDDMFHTCRVAGDHHRAKTMVGLLRDDVAGLYSKLSPRTLTDLRALKVLPPEQPHIFSDAFQPFNYASAPKIQQRSGPTKT